MADDREFVLFEGTEPTDDPADEWLPRLTIQQHGTYELHVIVGEEAEGMAEGVTPALFDAMAAGLIQKQKAVEMVAAYLRDTLDIDLSLQHAQAALGLPVDEV